MRTFDGNLNAYRALNRQQDVYRESMMARIESASTEEEMRDLIAEGVRHICAQGGIYKELGEEMVEIMNKK